MKKKGKKTLPIREVDTLPEIAVLNEVILNKNNGCFYLGVENNKKEVKGNGSRVEEARI